MKNSKDLKTTLASILDERMKSTDATAFEAFSEQLLDLGIERFNFDALTDEMTFYTKDRFVCSLVRSDVKQARETGEWKLGNSFNRVSTERAIAELDAGRLSGIEFHREIFSSGVVMCQVFLACRKIYYVGLNAQHYLEEY